MSRRDAALMAVDSNRAGDETRILMVDDHKLFSEVLKRALHQAGMHNIRVAENASKAWQLIEDEVPDLILMDLGLPDANGLELGCEILAEHPGVKIVIVTAVKDPKILKQAMAAGFSGYLTKDTQVDAFVTSLRAASLGEVVIQRGLAHSAAGAPSSSNGALRGSQLTARELEVLQLLAKGAGSVEITARLSVSPHTVRTHIQNILTKLQVRSRLEAAAFAIRHGLIDPPSLGDSDGSDY